MLVFSKNMVRFRILNKIHQVLLRNLIYDAWFWGIIVYLLHSIKIHQDFIPPTTEIEIDPIDNNIIEELNSINYTNRYIDFEGFNNKIGAKNAIVPNIVHYLNLNNTEISLKQYLSILSVIQYQRPQLIYIHVGNKVKLKGHYWYELTKKHNYFIVNNINHKETIFGVKSEFVSKHISDILRLEVLIHYGGIFLEENIYLAESLTQFLNYEMTVFSNSENSIQNNAIIANPNARFLKTIYDTYR